MTPENAEAWRRARGGEHLSVFMAKLRKATTPALLQTVAMARSGRWKSDVPVELRGVFVALVDAELGRRAVVRV